MTTVKSRCKVDITNATTTTDESEDEMTKSEITSEKLSKATGAELRAAYEVLYGKSTTDRNVKALRARLLKKIAGQTEIAIDEPAGAAGTPHNPDDHGGTPHDDDGDKPAAPVKAKKPAKTKAAKKSPAPKPEKKAAAPAKAKKPAAEKKPRAAKPASEKKAKPGKRGPSGPRGNTNALSILRKLKVGQIIEHNFRGGETVSVKVLAVPGADGKGGRYRWDGSEYDSLREIALKSSGIAWNEVLYFRLAPYPKHAPKSEKKGKK